MQKDRSARCSKCGKGQIDRLKSCINGERYHNFVKTNMPSYQGELKQIWEENKK